MTSTRSSGALPAEAARWLAVDLGSRPAQVVVAGATGGTGATTLTALVARCLATYRAPTRPRPSVAVLDHDGGTVHERSGAPAAGSPADADVLLRCLGAQALNPEPTLLDDPTVVAVVVVPWHQDGLGMGENAADRLGVERTVVVPVDVTRARTGGAVLGLPWDRALAAPGEISGGALAPVTRRAVLAVTAEVLSAARRVAVLTAR